MKRVLALALALVLSLSVGVIAFADAQDALDLGGGLTKDPDAVFYAPGHTYKVPVNVYDADGALVLDAKSAAAAYDDGYLKIAFKMVAGADYLDSWAVKQNVSKELYVEIKTKTLYIGKTPDFKYEIKVTFAKPGKIAEAIALSTKGVEANNYATSGVLGANLAKYFGAYEVKDGAKKATVVPDSKAGILGNNDYLTQKNNFKFGWGKVLEIKEGGFDHDYISGMAFDSSSDVDAKNLTDQLFVHFKKGAGEISNLNFGENAYVEVKFADQPEINLYYSEGAVKAITSKYPDVDFQFWDWRGKPSFDFTATVELTVDEDEVGEEPVLYFFDGANLTKVAADLEDGVFTFRTRDLGTFVAASKAVSTSAPIETTAAGAAATSAAGTGNPHTGVSDFVGVAVALAVVSMAAAGAVALKK